MIDELPTTVYAATASTNKRTAVHVKRYCDQLCNSQIVEIRAYPPEVYVADVDSEDLTLPTSYKWCGTCAYGYRYGTGVPARDILIEADPEDIPP